MASIRIDGEIYNDVDIRTGGYLDMIEDGRREWYVAEDHEAADAATLQYWRDLPASEVVCLVGEERIVQMWASGTTLDEWVSDIPACEQWGSYSGNESDIEPPTAAEREIAAAGARWAVQVTLPGREPFLALDDFATEAEAIRFAEQQEDTVPGCACDVVPSHRVEGYEDDDDIEQLQAFVAGWDELIEELGYIPTVAFRHN